MLIDTRCLYLADTTLLFGELANHSPLRSIINRTAETAKGVCGRIGGNYEAPKDTYDNGLCYENVHNHTSFTTMRMPQMMLN
jgi:hypothetical protein